MRGDKLELELKPILNKVTGQFLAVIWDKIANISWDPTMYDIRVYY